MCEGLSLRCQYHESFHTNTLLYPHNFFLKPSHIVQICLFFLSLFSTKQQGLIYLMYWEIKEGDFKSVTCSIFLLSAIIVKNDVLKHDLYFLTLLNNFLFILYIWKNNGNCICSVCSVMLLNKLGHMKTKKSCAEYDKCEWTVPCFWGVS